MHPIIALRFAWALVVMLSPVILLLMAFAPVARRYRTKVEQAWLLVLFGSVVRHHHYCWKQ